MANMEKVSAVEYQTEQGGTVTLSGQHGEWVVEDTNTGRTEHFATIPEFFTYCRENYTWPMTSCKNID